MEMIEISEVKRLVLEAIYTDDILSNLLVLKGGSALELYQISGRASLDIDLSLFELELTNEELKNTFCSVITNYFKNKGYTVFGFKFNSKPKSASDLKCLGYKITFKFLPEQLYKNIVEKNSKNYQKELHQKFIEFTGRSNTVQIELSKNEYCNDSTEEKFDDLYIRIYTPEMILIEKLRAICQQMEEYKERNKKAPRAKDFFDIYLLDKKYKIKEKFKRNNLSRLVKNIFDSKNVDVSLLQNIEKYKSFHEQKFYELENTVLDKTKLKDFGFYFDYVVQLANIIFDSVK